MIKDKHHVKVLRVKFVVAIVLVNMIVLRPQLKFTFRWLTFVKLTHCSLNMRRLLGCSAALCPSSSNRWLPWMWTTLVHPSLMAAMRCYHDENKVDHYPLLHRRPHGQRFDRNGRPASARFHRKSQHHHHHAHRAAPPHLEQIRVVGVTTPFRVVDGVAVSGMAETRVREFLKRSVGAQAASWEPELHPATAVSFSTGGGVSEDNDKGAPNSTPNAKVALFRFIIEKNGKWLTAVGNASRADSAKALCFMHALELIHHHSTVTSGSESSPGSEYDEGHSPAPLTLRETLGNAVSVRAPLLPRFARNPTDVLLQQQISVWTKYTQNVSSYLPLREEKQRAAFFEQYKVPFDIDEHPVCTLAAYNMVGNDRVDVSATTVFHNRLQAQKSPLPDVTYVRTHGSTVASITLFHNESSGTKPLKAIGVGRNKKDARAHCCAHALEILKILDTVDSEFGRASHPVGTGAEVDETSGRAYLSTTLQTVPLNRAKLLVAYLHLTGHACKSVFRRERSTSDVADCGMYRFVCTFELGDIVCEGQGINRYEAERAAVMIAIEELSDLDPVFARVEAFIKKYPNFDSDHLANLTLTASKRQAMLSALERCHSTLQTHVKQSPSLGIYLNGSVSSDSTRNAVPAWDALRSLEEIDSVAKIPHPDEDAATSSLATPSPQDSAAAATATDADARAVIERMGANRQDGKRSVGLTTAVPCSHESQRLLDELDRLRTHPKYLSDFHPRRSMLAMAKIESDVVSTVSQHQVTIICGTTGCGKTTQVPQYLFDAEIRANRGDRCAIVISQPRRISAFSIAERIASERLQHISEDVGYAVRLDSRPGKHITLCTTGILLQMFLGDPELRSVSHLILDEVHERDINCDVALALVKELITSGRNPNLRVVVMSATLDSGKFSAYFGGAPVLQIEGQTYPVQELYLEDVEAHAKTVGFNSPAFADMLQQREELRLSKSEGSGVDHARRLQPPRRIDYGLVAFAVDQSIRTFSPEVIRQRSILVFLPGWKEIMDAKAALERMRADLHIIVLHSTIDAAKQKECFRPAPHGTVKVILATNIAESGITIDDAAAVIDTGLIKLTSDHVLGRSVDVSGEDSDMQSTTATQQSATQLSLRYAGRANCTQRRGRAGRTQGGVCIRLFSKDVWEAMPPFLHPEILRTPLEQVVLRLLALGHHNPQRILSQFPDPPPSSSVTRALQTLRALEAVTSRHDNHSLTPLGRYLTLLPCEPRIGKMIVLGALMQCLDPILTLAAASDVTPFMTRRDIANDVRKQRLMFSRQSQSDHIAIINAFNSFLANEGSHRYASEHFLSFTNLSVIAKYKRQFHGILQNARLLPRCDDEDEERQTKLYVDRSETSQLWYDVELIKSCLGASLYPQIAVLLRDDALSSDSWGDGQRRKQHRSKKKYAMSIRNGMTLSPSRESACRPLPQRRSSMHDAVAGESEDHTTSAAAGPSLSPGGFFLYQGVFRVEAARQTFLTNVSTISPWAILLFAAPLNDLVYDSTLQVLSIGNAIHLKVDRETLEVVLIVKRLLALVMAIKFKDPAAEGNNHCLAVIRRICRSLLESDQSTLSGTHLVAPWTTAEQLRMDEQRESLDEDDDDDEVDNVPGE